MESYAIGKTLKKIRLDSQLTQDYIVKLANISRSSLSRIENDYQPISTDELMNMLDIYNVSSVAFFEKISDDSETGKLNQQFNNIMFHYQNYKNAKLELIKNDLLVFKNIFDKLNENQLFDSKYDIQWYLQLPQLYPQYFNPISRNLLKNTSLRILKKEHWLTTDYLFFACSIPFLEKEINNLLISKLEYFDLINLNNKSRRNVELIFENLSDYFLVHYKEYSTHTSITQLNRVFFIWKDYISYYNSMLSKIIYQHNFAMHEILFNLRSVDTIYSECISRYEALRVLDFDILANALQNEADDYKNKIFGNLNLNLVI